MSEIIQKIIDKYQDLPFAEKSAAILGETADLGLVMAIDPTDEVLSHLTFESFFRLNELEEENNKNNKE